MKNLSNYIETVGFLKEGDNSAAARVSTPPFSPGCARPKTSTEAKY